MPFDDDAFNNLLRELEIYETENGYREDDDEDDYDDLDIMPYEDDDE